MPDFWDRVDRSAGPNGCWPWLGAKDRNGYGRVQVGRAPRKMWAAHRRAWALTHDVAPSGVVLHTCDNPPCCNPVHLVGGSQGDNINDCVVKGRHANAAKTHCPAGHPYDETNTYVWTAPTGSRSAGNRTRSVRHCRACMRERGRDGRIA